MGGGIRLFPYLPPSYLSIFTFFLTPFLFPLWVSLQKNWLQLTHHHANLRPRSSLHHATIRPCSAHIRWLVLGFEEVFNYGLLQARSINLHGSRPQTCLTTVFIGLFYTCSIPLCLHPTTTHGV